jgi:hypothetical protein
LAHCRAQAGHQADEERAGRNTEHAELLSTDLNPLMFKRNWANPAAQDFAFNQLAERRSGPDLDRHFGVREGRST